VIRLPRAAVWALAIFLAVAFVAVGISKLQGPSAMRWAERFVHWGYPASAQYVIGVFEILAGLGVLIPRWRREAAAILVAIMIGALCTHAVYGEVRRLMAPLVLGGLAFLLYWSHLRPRGKQTPHC
jgi:putative oxidoreductase